MAGAFVDGPVRVRVPATSANLGPGFDSLGLSLDLHDELEAQVIDDGLVVEVSGEGQGEVPLDERHLVVRAMRLGLDHLGVRPPGLRLSCRNVIPHARGLGSSSAAIVGGLVLARTLVVDGEARLDDDALFDLAAHLEGHPDNVAPALYGGFVVAGRDATSFYAVAAGLDPRISAVVMVPPGGVETSLARGLLPASVPHADAAANAGRAALLVAALAGRPEQLLRGTRDLLHQHYRRPAMPETLDLVERLRERGHAAIVSGAGPTVLSFVVDEGPADAVLDDACPPGWRLLRLDLDRRGATVDR